eukprot:GGOE01020389.1.p1 GENE.GGOE01020389.1~~GGOE01020389.1.p1  ORF type:complete len:346 (+),score=50.82 GGOE01020389.1:68-1105(+)
MEDCQQGVGPTHHQAMVDHLIGLQRAVRELEAVAGAVVRLVERMHTQVHEYESWQKGLSEDAPEEKCSYALLEQGISNSQELFTGRKRVRRGPPSDSSDDVVELTMAPAIASMAAVSEDGAVLQVAAHVPTRAAAVCGFLEESTTCYVGTTKEGRVTFTEHVAGGWSTVPNDEATRRQRVLDLYWDFFPQRNLIKGIVYGVPDENRRLNFRAAYTITLWSADGSLLSAATVRPLRFPRHPPALEIVCTMTRVGLERRGFGGLLAQQIVREAEAQEVSNVYVKAERDVAPFWLKQGFVRAPFPSHVEHLCLRSDNTESLTLQVGQGGDSGESVARERRLRWARGCI